MKVVLYGATGHSGSRILAELTKRGHEVLAVSRHAVEKIPAAYGVKTQDDDLSDVGRIAGATKGYDAVVSAYAPPQDDTDQIVGVTERLVEGVKKNGGPRLVVVGGAGSLFVAPGVTLRASGHLPPEWAPIVDSHIKVLENLKKSSIDWTYFSPAAFFEPGERMGKFRLGKDDLIADEKGNSRISMEDYAIALVDELEKPQHRGGQRFTIGY
jgi:putative NADH-flavin reductase